MIFLESILLLIGLIISLVTLIKLDSNKNSGAKRTLSISYIVIFIISVILIIIKYEDTEESGLKLFKTLETIEKGITAQSDTIFTILDKTNDLKNRMDSIVSRTEKAIIQREQSQKIFSKQNEILIKSNELTQKQIEDSKPSVTTYTPHITFHSSDSINTLCRIVFTNEGNRIALKFKTKIFYAFKNKDLNYFDHVLSNHNITEIYPGKMIVNKDYLPIVYSDLLSENVGGTILILMNYYDELIDYYYEKKLLFDFEIQDDSVVVNKESSTSIELYEYLTTHNIKLSIE